MREMRKMFILHYKFQILTVNSTENTRLYSTLILYRPTNCHTFTYFSLQLRSQAFRKFTILPNIFQLLIYFNFIKHMVISMPICWLKMRNQFIIDAQEMPFPATQHRSKPKISSLSLGPLGGATFILTQMNNLAFARLTLQEAKSSKSLPLKFTYVTAACLN